MDKSKINIDQFFKNALQNFEGNANEAMFDAIKKEVDASKDSVDNYFKNALVGFEVNADDLSFDSIKDKINSPQVTIDSYFKEALLDYNSNAGNIPFLEIQNKLDRERVIDEYFKNALQNYEGKSHDKEFEIVRSKVLQLQQRESRKRYAWLLLILLIPAWFVGSNVYKEYINSDVSGSRASEISSPGKPNPAVSNESKERINSLIEIREKKEGQVLDNPRSNNLAARIAREKDGGKSSKGNSILDKNNIASKENNNTLGNEAVNGDSKDVATLEENKKEVEEPLQEQPKLKTTEPAAPIVSSERTTKPANTAIRKPKSNFSLEVSGAAALNSRYLFTDDRLGQYFATRNASDKQTTKFNFGLDLIKNVGRFNAGLGLHENQFGQRGTYQINQSLYDSIAVWDPTHTFIKGYIQWNFRDSMYTYHYNNVFTQVELPLHFSYTVCRNKKWDFQTGTGILLSYLANVKGALPNATSSEVVQLKNALNTMNRFGSAVTVTMKFHYNLSDHWQLGSDIYLKSSVTSLYKKNTGITELPYSFGWRWGIGFKF